MAYRAFRITDWSHNPARRKHRFRCQVCDRIIGDGADVVIEKRGKSSHGYHTDCFKDGGIFRDAVVARCGFDPITNTYHN